MFTYSYTEQEFAENRVVVGDHMSFGQYQYIAAARQDAESRGANFFSNAGRLGKTIFSLGFAHEPMQSRHSTYDVTYRLSSQHYGAGYKDWDAQDQAWLQDYKNGSVQALSTQLQEDYKYFYIEQFGLPIVAETIGGALRLRSAAIDARVNTGGVGPATPEYVPSRTDFSGKQVGHIKKVNNRFPINSQQYAGQVMPLPSVLAKKYGQGVRFKRTGFPDFAPWAKKSVPINMTGDRYVDAMRANKAAGFKQGTPANHTWHHVEDGRTMQLVPTPLHEYVKHTGGAAIVRGQ